MLESLSNKVVDLNVCNSIKKRLQHSCFSVKFANFLRAASVVTSDVWVMFSKESEQKPVLLSAVNTIFSRRNVFAARKVQKQPP